MLAVAPAPGLRFSKMHGAGNDFVVIDALEGPPGLSPAQLRWLGDRHRGVGFDQLLLIERSRCADSGFAYRIFNTDGSAARQCGNGARCVVAWLLARAGLRLPAQIESPAGMIEAGWSNDGQIEVGLGRPDFSPASLPLRLSAEDTRGEGIQLELEGQRLRLHPLSLGNPHLVLRVTQLDTADVAGIGAALNAHPALPDGVNVSFVEVRGADRLGLRVYERGVGETLACGSGACAAAITALRQRWVSAERITLALPGGELQVRWPNGAEVRLAGPAVHVYDAELAPGWDAHARSGA